MIRRALAWMRAHKARAAAMAASFVVAWIYAWEPLVGDRLDEIDKRKGTIAQLKQDFIEKKRLAVNVDAYRAQLAEARGSCDLMAQAGGAREGNAHDRIARAALSSGLRVVSLKVEDTRQMSEFFSRESPAELRVSGGYHQVGRFVESLSVLRDFPIVEAMRVERDEGGAVLLTARLHLVRMTTDEEARAWQKANPAPKKKGRK